MAIAKMASITGKLPNFKVFINATTFTFPSFYGEFE